MTGQPPLETPEMWSCAPEGRCCCRDHVVKDAEGQIHRTTRPISAVCRCGKTGRAPWCDGTHKLLRPAPATRD